jgi:AcrR family transcriptional regulator
MSDTTATDGRVIGERALQTRRRILDATAALLREQGALDVKVMDVAREVGTSPATFYQYFADVEDAIFALALELPDKVAFIQAQFDLDWTGPKGLDLVRQAVSEYTDFWDENAAVLRVLLLRADERDERFHGLDGRQGAFSASSWASHERTRRGSHRWCHARRA